MVKKALKIKINILLAFILLSTVVYAQTPGSLDLSFGTNGMVITDYSSCNDYLFSAVMQNDGKIIAGGYSYDYLAEFYYNFIVRYNPNGSKDNSFGTNGIVTTYVGTENAIRALALQNNGKLIAAGQYYYSGSYDLLVIRYNSNGSLDATFGVSGIAKTSILKHDYLNAMEIQPDGKIVLGGVSYTISNDNYFTLARFDTNGVLDNTFGTNGKVTTLIDTIDNRARALKLLPGGKILLAGFSADTNGLCYHTMVRYLNNGQLDNTFGNNGIVVSPLFSSSYIGGIRSLDIQADGKILAGGSILDGGIEVMAIARYDTTGKIDSTFGVNGVLISSPGNAENSIQRIKLQPDGKIVATGYSQNSPGSNKRITILRCTPDGIMDSTFGNNGIVIINIASQETAMAKALLIQPDGKIISAGNVDFGMYYTTGYDFVLIRLYGDILVSVPEEIPRNINSRIYPNPTTGLITLTFDENDAMRKCQIQVFNLQGKKLLENEITKTKTQIDLSGFASGIYFLKIYNEDKTEMVKIIKQ